MKIVVIGYSKMFASIIDATLQSRHELVGVFRHERVKYNPLRLFIKDMLNPSNDISLIKSKKLYEIEARSVNSEKFKKEILRLNPDIIFVCSWSEKIKKEIFQLPKVGMINIHPSLLPKYRGSNPYAWVLFNNEKSTGVTFHLVDENLDTGAILMQKRFEILESDDGLSLKNKAASLAGVMCQNFLENSENSVIMPIPQDEKEASYYPKLSVKDAIVDLSQPSNLIAKRIKGLYPWAKAYIDCNGRFLEVKDFSVSECPNKLEVGTVVSKFGRQISMVTSDNKIITFYNLKLMKTILSPSTRLFIKFGLGDKIRV